MLKRKSSHLLFSQIRRFNSVSMKNVSTNVEPINMAYKSFVGTDIDNGVPPLLIAHGLFGSKQNWNSISKALMNSLNPRRKIVTVDLRNHGESPHSPYHSYAHLSGDIGELMKQINIERASLLGHSMGGRAAMYFALENPNLVDRLIVVDISPVRSPNDLFAMEKVFNAMKSSVQNIQSSLSLAEGRRVVEERLSKVLDKATINFLLLNLKKDESGKFMWRVNIQSLQGNFDTFSIFPKEMLKREYRGPVLFIGGSKSDFISQDDLPKIRKIFPKADLIWLDTGHLVHVEMPYDFIKTVIDFLEK